MATKSGSDIFAKYRRNMVNATPDIIAGIENTQKDQAKNAIKAKQKYLDGLAKANAEDSWVKGLGKSGHEKWRKNAIAKGVPKITAGIDANEQEIIATFEKVARIGEAVSKAVANMPDNGIEDSIARAAAAMRFQQEAWKKV